MRSHPVYFLRHGETQWNLERRLQGQRDIPLNDTGHGQAKAMAAKLVEVVPDAVVQDFTFFVSPLTRTRETMSHVQTAYGLVDDALTIDDRLKELNFGDQEGKMWSEVDQAAPNREADPAGYHDWVPTGGESYSTAIERVRAWYDDIKGPAIVVSHGGISRILRGFVLGLAKSEIVELKVPQTKFFRLTGSALDWFDARSHHA